VGASRVIAPPDAGSVPETPPASSEASSPPSAAVPTATEVEPAAPPPTCETATERAIFLEIVSRESPSDREHVKALMVAQRPMMVAYCKKQTDPSALIACLEAAEDNLQMSRCYHGLFPAR
jgi:hypothetical protein